MKTAFLFPGQGSQAVGMALDLYREFDYVRELFDMVEEITRTNISKLCFKGPMEELTATINLQPSIAVVNLALLAVIEREGVKPDVTAGHSLGEYNALRASGVISGEDTARLVYKRGQLMHREATKHKGAMHAIIGLPIKMIQEIIDTVQKEGIVSVANHNAEKQIVITGSPESVKKASSLAAEQGARAIPLKVSGAWHSELIKGAEETFKEFLAGFSFSKPESAIAFNVTADFAWEPDEIKSLMVNQLCSPVKWYDCMGKLQEENVDIFAEVGPGKVLTGLLKKTLPKDYGCKIFNVSDLKTLEEFLKAVA